MASYTSIQKQSLDSTRLSADLDANGMTAEAAEELVAKAAAEEALSKPPVPTTPPTQVPSTGRGSVDDGGVTDMVLPPGVTSQTTRERPWGVCDLRSEFERQGALSSGWRVTTMNAEWKVSPSYPETFCVPASVCDTEVRAACAFRKLNRVPTLSWYHSLSGGAILRSSQPLTGFTGTVHPADQGLLSAARDCASSTWPRMMCILDARPQLNAESNKFKGGGYQKPSHFRRTPQSATSKTVVGTPGSAMQPVTAAAPPHAAQLSPTWSPRRSSALLSKHWAWTEFAGIGNIHVMRNALQRLLAPSTKERAKGVTVWLGHLSLVMRGAVRVAELVESGLPVLVHCSHGWDRTAQVTALAEVLLDPYYRTIDGFRVAVEKSFCSFGHQFQRRVLAPGPASKACLKGVLTERWLGFDTFQSASQFSPIILQFLEGVHQLLLQFPTTFEFNDAMLLFLSEHCASGWFGNFEADSERMRVAANRGFPCRSVWEHIRTSAHVFRNTKYRPVDVFPGGGPAGRGGRLPPLMSPSSLVADVMSEAKTVEVAVPPAPFHAAAAVAGPGRCKLLWPVRCDGFGEWYDRYRTVLGCQLVSTLALSSTRTAAETDLLEAGLRPTLLQRHVLTPGTPMSTLPVPSAPSACCIVM